MNDDEFNQMVRCQTCDEELIKRFMDDHQCDQAKLNRMVRNSQGQLASPLVSLNPKFAQEGPNAPQNPPQSH